MPGEIARHIAGSFELPTVGLYDRWTDTVSWAGTTEWPETDAALREVATTGTSQPDVNGLLLCAIQLGGAPIGSLALNDARLSDTVRHSITNLAAIGLERARAYEATTRADAARESSELRATVLDALAHEFKTPLTSMKAASSDLRARATGHDRELIAILDEEVDRLGALVTDAVRMLRIDAGDFTIQPGRHDVARLAAAAMARFERQLDGHDVIERIPRGLTIDADAELLGLALRQLLDNALKYSTPSSTNEVTAAGNGDVQIAVRNSGSVIAERDQARVFERFYRGQHAPHVPGTGMGLAIVERIARAHGGSLKVSSTEQDGTTFTLVLPRAAGAA